MSEHLYFPVYERIEKEVLELSSAIYFSDDHVGVYSIYIADLILRCSVELESIAKEIYRKETKTDPTSPGECFAWMEQHWKISKKAISVDSPHFHFSEKIFPMFCPFDYKNNSAEDYYSQYNAIKHDRVKNLTKANIYTLIRVLAALYILNLYYSNDCINLNDDKFGQKVDRKNHSKIFSFYIAPCVDTIILDSQKSLNPECCIYQITRKESHYAFQITYTDIYDELQSFKIVKTDDCFQQYAKSCLTESVSIETLIDFLSQAINEPPERLRDIIIKSNNVKELLSVQSIKMKSSYWAELNRS